MKVINLFGHALLGGLIGFVIRLIIYIDHKTPAIEFDGPAAASFALAILTGCILSMIIGFTSIKRKNRFL